jgi:hypothetical protein
MLTNGSEIAIVQEINEKEGPFLAVEQDRMLTNSGGTSRVSR